MEKLFMSAGIVSVIVLCIVGIAKTPFSDFKKKHSNGYRAIFTGLSIILSIAMCVLDELYILEGSLLSLEFAILICTVFAGVFGSYNAYEGLGAKKLVSIIAEKIKQARDISKHKKAVEYLYKIDDIEEAINILLQRKNNNSEV